MPCNTANACRFLSSVRHATRNKGRKRLSDTSAKAAFIYCQGLFCPYNKTSNAVIDWVSKVVDVQQTDRDTHLLLAENIAFKPLYSLEIF